MSQVMESQLKEFVQSPLVQIKSPKQPPLQQNTDVTQLQKQLKDMQAIIQQQKDDIIQQKNEYINADNKKANIFKIRLTLWLYLCYF